jgi:intracellular sulfur oxidation DsrE/DsrF family protein
LLILWLLFAVGVAAEERVPAEVRYLANLELHTAAELLEVLSRAEELLLDDAMAHDAQASVTLLMHGPEVRVLLRDNYRDNQELVDLAARLSALGVVQIKACRTWMGGHSVDERQLQAFVGTVPDAVEEARMLIQEQNYIAF